jgi:hypothetical protein
LLLVSGRLRISGAGAALFQALEWSCKGVRSKKPGGTFDRRTLLSTSPAIADKVEKKRKEIGAAGQTRKSGFGKRRQMCLARFHGPDN